MYIVCCLSVQSSENLCRQRNRGSDRMRTIQLHLRPPQCMCTQTRTLTHTPSSHGEQHSFSLNHCVCVFRVYRYEASTDNQDSEAAMCEGRDQMRSSGMASLEVSVLSCVRKSVVFVYQRSREGGGEDALSWSIYQDGDILHLTADRKENVQGHNSAK